MDREFAHDARRIVGKGKSTIQAELKPMGARVLTVSGEPASRVEVDCNHVPVHAGATAVPRALLGFSELYAVDRLGQWAWRKISGMLSVVLPPALQRFLTVLLDGGTQ